MSETQQSAQLERRVMLDVEVDKLPELLELLGGFIAEHSLTITVVDTTDPVEDQALAPEETLWHNPDLAMDARDAEGNTVPVVSAGILKSFSRTMYDGKTGPGTRLANGLMGWLAFANQPVIESFMLMAEPKSQNDSRPNVIGIRVDRIQSLNTAVQNETISLANVGEKSIHLLDVFTGALFAPQSNGNS